MRSCQEPIYHEVRSIHIRSIGSRLGLVGKQTQRRPECLRIGPGKAALGQKPGFVVPRPRGEKIFGQLRIRNDCIYRNSHTATLASVSPGSERKGPLPGVSGFRASISEEGQVPTVGAPSEWALLELREI